jgi:hypothetical protein
MRVLLNTFLSVVPGVLVGRVVYCGRGSYVAGETLGQMSYPRVGVSVSMPCLWTYVRWVFCTYWCILYCETTSHTVCCVLTERIFKAAFLKIFQVGTTFISQNVLRTTFISHSVLRTTLLLSPLKANLSFFWMVNLFKVKDACCM